MNKPDKVDGCPWEAWGGPFGISRDLVVFDGGKGGAIGNAKDLTFDERTKLAVEMSFRWLRFANGATTPAKEENDATHA